LRDDIDEHVDIIAERVAQLDGVALGTVQTVGQATQLAPYPTDIRKVADHVGALVQRYAALSASTREAIDTADEAGDADTADIFTAFSRVLDKNLWFLKSHLE
jgi:starvation-inducible DNA-binding protein